MQELEAKLKIFGQKKIVEAKNYPAPKIAQNINFGTSGSTFAAHGQVCSDESEIPDSRFEKSGSTWSSVNRAQTDDFTKFGKKFGYSGSTGFTRNRDPELTKFGRNFNTNANGTRKEDEEATESTKFGQNSEDYGSIEFYDEGIERKGYDNLTFKFELDAVTEEETDV